MKPVSIVLSINAALAAVILLLLWGLADIAKLAALGCGSLAVFNLAIAGVFFVGKEKKFGIAFLAGFAFSVVVTLLVLGVIHTYFPEEFELLRSREG